MRSLTLALALTAGALGLLALPSTASARPRYYGGYNTYYSGFGGGYRGYNAPVYRPTYGVNYGYTPYRSYYGPGYGYGSSVYGPTYNYGSYYTPPTVGFTAGPVGLYYYR